MCRFHGQVCDPVLRMAKGLPRRRGDAEKRWNASPEFLRRLGASPGPPEGGQGRTFPCLAPGHPVAKCMPGTGVPCPASLSALPGGGEPRPQSQATLPDPPAHPKAGEGGPFHAWHPDTTSPEACLAPGYRVGPPSRRLGTSGGGTISISFPSGSPGLLGLPEGSHGWTFSMPDTRAPGRQLHAWHRGAVSSQPLGASRRRARAALSMPGTRTPRRQKHVWHPGAASARRPGVSALPGGAISIAFPSGSPGLLGLPDGSHGWTFSMPDTRAPGRKMHAWHRGGMSSRRLGASRGGPSPSRSQTGLPDPWAYLKAGTAGPFPCLTRGRHVAGSMSGTRVQRPPPGTVVRRLPVGEAGLASHP